MSPALYASCRVGDLLVGFDVAVVQEVTVGSALTPVPLASSLIAGLLNLRGAIVTAIDLRRCLQLAERPADQAPIHVIVSTPGGSVSLVVDEVGDVLTVDTEDLAEAPQTLPGPLRDLMSGAYTLGDELLLAVKVERVVAIACSERART
jgi:purine-binding chemotaxis protein CheW